MYSTEVAWSQIIGTREYQQDHAAIISWPNGFRLLLLADGMGGHTGGDIASHCVIDTFREHFIKSAQEDMRLRMIDSLDAANRTLYHKIKDSPELSGMGTTLVAAIFDGLSLQWISVGDSPMWLIRGGSIKRLNQNHSMSEVLAAKVAAGEMTSEAAAESPMRTQLLEAVMGENIELLDAPESTLRLELDDWLILASDGVETCSEEQILDISLSSPESAEVFTTSLLAAVKDVGKHSQDNASVVIMQVNGTQENALNTLQPVEGELVDEPQTEN